MKIRLREIALLVDGTVSGDEDLEITGTASIQVARPGQITLADGEQFLEKLESCDASAALVPHGLRAQIPTISVDDVPSAFARVVLHFRPARPRISTGISPAAHVSSTAILGRDVDIHAGATVGDQVEVGARSVIHAGARIMAGCKLAEDVQIFPNVVMYEDTIVGARAVIHAAAVVGAYGFGYETIQGRHVLSAQLGHVEIGSDVEIGACTTIDRGTYDATVIGEGTKIDNQVMIAHNCRIGRHNIICSQVGIAGSSTTGDYVVLAGQVGIRDHVHIGEGAALGAKAGVMNDIPAGKKYLGIPATPEREQLMMLATLGQLPAMRKELKALRRAIETICAASETPKKQDAA